MEDLYGKSYEILLKDVKEVLNTHTIFGDR